MILELSPIVRAHDQFKSVTSSQLSRADDQKVARGVQPQIRLLRKFSQQLALKKS